MMVIGSADGIVSRMRFRVPLAPGSELDKIEVQSLHRPLLHVPISKHRQQLLTTKIMASLNCTTA